MMSSIPASSTAIAVEKRHCMSANREAGLEYNRLATITTVVSSLAPVAPSRWSVIRTAHLILCLNLSTYLYICVSVYCKQEHKRDLGNKSQLDQQRELLSVDPPTDVLQM
jgi:hypothetical protein